MPAEAASPLGRELARAGSSLADLARHLGVDRRAVAAWGRDGRRPRRSPHLAAAEAWLAARGVDPSTLWHDPATPTPEPTMDTPSLEYLEPDELQQLGLADDPFGDPPSPEDVFLSPALRQCENALVRAARQRHIIALTGPAGAGKSTLLRRFFGSLGRDKRVKLIAPASLDRTRITGNALAVAILRDLTGRDTSGMAAEPRSELLRSTLAEQDAAGLYPTLLIDEAHHMAAHGLLALKAIWDSHTLFKQLAIILVGQDPLRRRLEGDATVREVAGRTRVVQVPELGAQTGDYLRWRWARVGGDADRAFTVGAYQALSARGRQGPLWVNNYAVRALRYALSVGDTRVDVQHVGRV